MDKILANLLPSFPQKMRRQLFIWFGATLLAGPLLAQVLFVISAWAV